MKADVRDREGSHRSRHFEVAPIVSCDDLSPDQAGQHNKKGSFNQAHDPDRLGSQNHCDPASGPQQNEQDERTSANGTTSCPTGNCGEQEASQHGTTVAKHHFVHMKDYASVHGHRTRPERMGCNPERDRDCGPDGAQQKEGPEAITEERMPPIVALWFDRGGHDALPRQVLSALRVAAFQTRIASLLANQRPLPAFGTARRAKCF